MQIYELIGYIGGAFLAGCSLPQCWQVFSTRQVKDINFAYLVFWLAGVILVSYYLIMKSIYTCGDLQYQLLFNYGCNFIMACYLLYAKLIYK